MDEYVVYLITIPSKKSVGNIRFNKGVYLLWFDIIYTTTKGKGYVLSPPPAGYPRCGQ